MFCPQCGQRQSSDDVRFCSRCGLLLEGVMALLAGNGVLPAFALQEGNAGTSPRRLGVQQGGKILLIGLFIIPLMLVMHELFGTPQEFAFAGMLTFFAGILRLIYALLFQEGPLRRPKGLSQGTYARPVPSAMSAPQGAVPLPPSKGAPLYSPPRVNTSEIGYRPSVAEGTTRLLGDQPDDAPPDR